jgi:hypothetical protein
MDEKIYEKVVNGENLNKVFDSIGRLDIFENFTVHVETIDGTKNNYIYKTKDGNIEVTNLYVSESDLRTLKTV